MDPFLKGINIIGLYRMIGKLQDFLGIQVCSFLLLLLHI